VAEIERNEGRRGIHEVEYALLVTELFGSASRCLECCRDVFGSLHRRGWNGKSAAIAHEVQREHEIARLSEILNSGVYCISLECFTRREKIMGRYKGRPLAELRTQAKLAIAQGFENVMFNYIGGLEGFVATTNGVEMFAEFVHSIGLNVFMPLTDTHSELIAPEAQTAGYYWELLKLLDSFEVAIYTPTMYERSPALTAIFRPYTIDEWDDL
jgi:hypothetical protein